MVSWRDRVEHRPDATSADGPRLRDAACEEAARLQALQRRSSAIWEQYREQLAAHSDAIELPQNFIDRGWVRVAAGAGDVPVGLSVVIPGQGGVYELDGCSSSSIRCSVGSAAVSCRTPAGERGAPARMG